MPDLPPRDIRRVAFQRCVTVSPESVPVNGDGNSRYVTVLHPPAHADRGALHPQGRAEPTRRPSTP